jgi:hypothetical protein
MNTLYLTWIDIERMVDKIAWSVKAKDREQEKTLEFVGTGVGRGGLIPAVMLSHRLDLPLAFHWGYAQGLWVDDICITGRTAQQYIEKENLETACLLTKHQPSMVDHLADDRIIEPATEVIFPWEIVPPEGLTDQWGHLYPHDPPGKPLTELLGNGAVKHG